MEPATNESGQDHLLTEGLRSRAKTLAIFLILALLPSVGFVIVACNSALSFSGIPTLEYTESVPTCPDLPPFYRSSRRLIVLVMDVSGSMAKTDASFEQNRAAALSLQIYYHMARIALPRSDPPDLAVILYSSVAQPLALGRTPWTTVGSVEELEGLQDDLRQVLAKKQPIDSEDDPRRGYHTDHLAAARATGRLLQKYRQEYGESVSACVLFMTDGLYDPCPFADASLTAEQRKANLSGFFDRVKKAANSSQMAHGDVLEEIREEYEDLLVRAADCGPIQVDRVQQEMFPVSGLWRAVREHVPASAHTRYAEFVDDLPTGSGGDGIWFVDECRLLKGDLFQAIFLDQDSPDPQPTPDGRAVRVQHAEGLLPSYAQVIASWLNLHSCRIESENSFYIEPASNVLAVVLNSNTMPATLRFNNQSYEFESGLALIPRPGAGMWRVADCSTDTRIHAYANSPYRWVFFKRPCNGYSHLDPPPELSVALFNLEDKTIASPEALYSDYPPHLKCRLEFPGGMQATTPLAWSSEDTTYVGSLPTPDDMHTGPVTLGVTISDLQLEGGQSARPVEIATSTFFHEGVSLELFYLGEDGKPVQVRGIQDLKLTRGGKISKL